MLPRCHYHVFDLNGLRFRNGAYVRMLKVYWPLAKNTTILPAKISWNPEYGFPYTGRHPNKPSSAVLSPDIQCNVSFNNVESVIFLSHLNMMRRVCDMFIKAKDGVYLKSQVTCRGGYSNLVSPLFQVLHVFRTDFKRMSALFGMSFIQHPQIKSIISFRKSGIRRL